VNLILCNLDLVHLNRDSVSIYFAFFFFAIFRAVKLSAYWLVVGTLTVLPFSRCLAQGETILVADHVLVQILEMRKGDV
jgi:hypothetical protein